MVEDNIILSTHNLSVTAAGRTLLSEVSLDIPRGGVVCLIGPSGAGKSTLLKCLNRLIDLTRGLRAAGDVRFHGKSIFARGTDTDALRARIGMIFQQPVVFPGSIYKNVIFGVKHLGVTPRRDWLETAEQALREAALWDEVKDRLHDSALKLSVGQQQRLCLARTLAVRPEVILMDEPTSALDPRSTEAIEDLTLRLREKHTIVVVTHQVKQARRLADTVAFLAPCQSGICGELLECGPAAGVLDDPCCGELQDFLTQA